MTRIPDDYTDDTPNADAPARDDQTPGPGYEELPAPTDDEFSTEDFG